MAKSNFKVVDITSGIWAHLDRMAFDKSLNPAIVSRRPLGFLKLDKYIQPSCKWNMVSIVIKYRIFGEEYLFSNEEALKYLEWLDAGNNGTHLEMLNTSNG